MTVVRRARVSDHAALVALWAEVDGLHADLLPDLFRRSSRAHEPAELERILADRDQALLVGADGGELRGFVHVLLYDTPPAPLLVPRRRGHVDCLVVTAEARRGGLGRRLMEEAAAWARERGAGDLLLTVWAGNEEAEAFYEAIGYRRLSSLLRREL